MLPTEQCRLRMRAFARPSSKPCSFGTRQRTSPGGGGGGFGGGRGKGGGGRREPRW
jgi:hypothetical protein